MPYLTVKCYAQPTKSLNKTVCIEGLVSSIKPNFFKDDVALSKTARKKILLREWTKLVNSQAM